MTVSNRETDLSASETRKTEPRAAFRHEITIVELRRSQCASAIDDHDFEAVQHIAEDVAMHWLAGRYACGRLIEGLKDTSPYALAARAVLEKNYMALLELFALAAKTIAVPGMRQRLERARATLIAANEGPLLADPIATRDKRE